MAKAGKEPTAGPWPAEGLPLKETLARVAPDEWRAYSATKDAASGIRLCAILAGSGVTLTADERQRFNAKNRAWATCLSTLVDAWNRGDIIAKGKRGDPLARAVDIPAPSTSWHMHVLNLSRSQIRDPAKRDAKIFDLRFWSTDKTAATLPPAMEPTKTETPALAAPKRLGKAVMAVVAILDDPTNKDLLDLRQPQMLDAVNERLAVHVSLRTLQDALALRRQRKNP